MLTLFIGFISPTLVAQSGTPNPEPINPHATPEARALLAYLDSISGQATVTGQHNFPDDGSRWTDLTYDLTGKYPGLFGEDFGFSAGDDKDSVLSRPAMIEEVKRQNKPYGLFFDQVTVNAEDPALRANRLKLLAGIRAALGAVADFSKIEG